MQTAKLALSLLAVFIGTGLRVAEADGVFAGWRYTTEATGARDADRIAWIDQQHGLTELKIADGPDYRPRTVATSQPNDGVPIEALSISADGHWLAWDRGGVGDAAGVGQLADRGVWLAPPQGPPCRIGEGARPTLSPDSSRLAWMSRGRLWVAPLAPDCASIAASAVPVASGGVVAPVWSPDGADLAFELPLGRTRRIGLWSASTGLRWIDNAGQLDVAPAWSPEPSPESSPELSAGSSADGRRLAFLRIDPSDDATANQYDEDPPAPFSVMLTPTEVPAPRTLWRSPGADGFARQWRSRTTAPLLWLDTRQLAVLSEHTGWQHVHALSPLTSAPAATVRDLTPGTCEVGYADVMRGSQLVVTDNCTGVDRRRLLQIDSRGGRAVALTPPDGMAIQPQAFDHGRRLVYRAGDGQLQTVRVHTQDGEIAPEPEPAHPFPCVKVESISLKAADGVALNAQVFRSSRPEGLAAAASPAIIFLHGGPQQQSVAGAASSSFYSRFGWMNMALAARGYLVLQLNYRSGTGQGRDFRRIRGVARNGAGELQDVLAAQAWLAARKDVRADRIGVWGDSWGGWLTALALARHSDRFRAGVVVSGVYDLSETSFGPALPPAAKALARVSSAAGAIDQWRSPVLIVHGERDNTVPFSQATEMRNALQQRGRDVSWLSFPREAHALQLERDWETLFETVTAFLARTLPP
jgi:dipeptidyl aminopeptidase/acylaminoacyl peptidase